MKVKRARKFLEKLAKNCYRTSCSDCVFLDNNGSCIFKREPSAIYEDFLQEHMDNKQAIEELKTIKQNHIDLNYRFRHLYDDYIVAIDKAIASLEAWDKVKEDVKHSQFMFLSGDKEVECIPIFVVMNIINRNLGGE